MNQDEGDNWDDQITLQRLKAELSPEVTNETGTILTQAHWPCCSVSANSAPLSPICQLICCQRLVLSAHPTHSHLSHYSPQPNAEKTSTLSNFT